MKKVYQKILAKQEAKKKSLAVLIDPDHINIKSLEQSVKIAVDAGVDYFFVGGSLITNDGLDITLDIIKKNSAIPSVIFPGSVYQINSKADAILLLSLISGRNPEMLIGKHVTAAPLLKDSGLEILPTGYLLVDSGKPTTVSYMSNTNPIPHNKPTIAACTALAGEMLGLKLTFLDGGSGALNPVDEEMVIAVKKMTTNPIIIGGGIKTPEKAHSIFTAGADIVVVGNAFENNPSLIKEIGASTLGF